MNCSLDSSIKMHGSPPKTLRLTILGLMSIATISFLGVVAQRHMLKSGFAAKHITIPYKNAGDQTLKAEPLLDADAEHFFGQASQISTASECFPLHIKDIDQIGVLNLYCSDSAYGKDGDALTLSDHIYVHQDIARRYNFWRRIYSLWSTNQFVMHVSIYPEVVLEVYDGTRLSSELSPVKKEKEIKKLAKERRKQYKKLLLTMHRHRKEEHRFSPAMQRIAKSMRHIQHADKYSRAAYALRLQKGQRDFIANGLIVAQKYLPAIEKEFISQDIPVEISRLAFVESSFNLKAHSKVGASGVYQIMPATGKQYLKIYGGIDERNDPIKASRAAAKLLRLNYRLTGSWPLAITAYNHGVGGIRRAVRTVGTNDIVQLINKYEGRAFGFASKNFYASFLGVYATLKDAHRIFPDVPQDIKPLQYEDIKLTKATSINTLKKTHQVSAAEIAELNPDLSWRVVHSNGVLPRGYTVKIPADPQPADNMKLVVSDEE